MKVKFFLCLLAVLLSIGCSKRGDDNVSTDAQSEVGANGLDTPALRVPTWPLVKKNWAPNFFANGAIELLPLLEIVAPSDGVLTELYVSEGDAAHFSSPLFRLDTGAVAQGLASQRAEYESLLQRYSQLSAQIASLHGNGSDTSLDESVMASMSLEGLQARRAEVISRMQLIDAQMQRAMRELFQAEVLAPLAASVGSSGVAGNAILKQGDVVLAIKPVQAVAARVRFAFGANDNLAVSAADSLWVGMECQLKSSAFGGLQFSAMLQRLQFSQPDSQAKVGDPGNRASKVEALLVLDNPGARLQPGMPVRARCEGQWREDILVLPRKALVDQGAAVNTVYVVEEGAARQRVIALGMGDRENLPVLAGLEQGDELVIGKTGMLAEGLPVKILKWVKVTVKDDY